MSCRTGRDRVPSCSDGDAHLGRLDVLVVTFCARCRDVTAAPTRSGAGRGAAESLVGGPVALPVLRLTGQARTSLDLQGAGAAATVQLLGLPSGTRGWQTA